MTGTAAAPGLRQPSPSWVLPARPASRACGGSLAAPRGVECLLEIVDSPDLRLIRLVGRLTDAHVPDLLQACAAAGRTVRLELRDLVSIDAAGLDVLRRLRHRGTLLVDAPVYIQLKIDAAPARDLPPRV